MPELFPVLIAVYVVGVVWGVVAGDAPPAARRGLARAWPLGPLAFLLTVALLLAAAPAAFIGRR